MKVKDLESCIASLREEFGDISDREVFIDTTFGYEIMVSISDTLVTRLAELDDEEDR